VKREYYGRENKNVASYFQALRELAEKCLTINRTQETHMFEEQLHAPASPRCKAPLPGTPLPDTSKEVQANKRVAAARIAEVRKAVADAVNSKEKSVMIVGMPWRRHTTKLAC